MTERNYTVREARAILGVSQQRMNRKLKDGHYPNHRRCECGNATFIPESDLQADIERVVARKFRGSC